MAKIGIYGGSFDPPHIGHIRGAKAAVQALGLDTLVFMPIREVQGKLLSEGTGTPEDRLRMLRLATEEDPQLQVSDWEATKESCRTWETVVHFRELYPGDEIVLLLGSDLLFGLHTWKRVDVLLRDAHIAVLRRGTRGETARLEETAARLRAEGGRVTLLDNPVEQISSTQLRRLLAFGAGWEFLPPNVAQYIRDRGLYNVKADWKRLPMEQLEPIVLSLLKPDRVKHVLGCRDTAVELARRWGADEEDAARAGLLHDITKALDGPLQLTLCDAYGRMLSDFSRRYPKTLHALTGSLVAERIFGENEQVVSAICHHTTGKADMTLLQKIIYVADYMEPCRNFPGVEDLRNLAYVDMDAALKLGLEMTLQHLARQGAEVSPESREALAWLNERKER